MKQLRGFSSGLIGTPVNHGNKHWALLLLDQTGQAYYYDSSGDFGGREMDSKVQALAHIVLIISIE